MSSPIVIQSSHELQHMSQPEAITDEIQNAARQCGISQPKRLKLDTSIPHHLQRPTECDNPPAPDAEGAASIIAEYENDKLPQKPRLKLAPGGGYILLCFAASAARAGIGPIRSGKFLPLKRVCYPLDD